MGAFQDLTGQKFGKLTVIRKGNCKVLPSGRHQIMWICKCECGNEIAAQANNLKSGHTISCGCARDEIGEKLTHDLTGMRFNRLTVIRQAEKSKSGETRWVCRCDCGNETIVQSNNLKSGLVKSCGCLKREYLVEAHTTHGGSKQNGKRTKLYSVWVGMRRRCYDKNDGNYYRYGGRGITVCDAWKEDFAAFRAWAVKNGYRPHLTIDRINNNKGYSPDNCRWAGAKEQARNRRSNRTITFNGETHIMVEWAEITGLSVDTLYNRIVKYSWPVDRALTEPCHNKC